MVTASGTTGQRHVGPLVTLILLILLFAAAATAGVLSLRSDWLGSASSPTRGSGVPITRLDTCRRSTGWTSLERTPSRFASVSRSPWW